MPLSLAEQHRKRVERLVKGVKDYAAKAGIEESAASRRILNQSHELERLIGGGLLSPLTLERREETLAEKLAELHQEESAA